MKKTITEKDIKEIIKTYPNPLNVAPRATFNEQLKIHLCKYFGFKMENVK